MRKIGATARVNAMTGETEMAMPGCSSLENTGDAVLDTIVHACVHCRMKGDRQIHGAVLNIAKAHAYHPVDEWIRATPWDGGDRIGALCTTLKLRDPADEGWKCTIVEKWLIQAAVAIGNYKRRDPISVPYVLTLQGPERRGKSKWVKSLLPAPWVADGVTMRLDGFGERDAVRRATRQPITELGELDASFKRSDHSGLKNFLSTTRDTYRDAYGRTETSRARCTAFAATVNPQNFLIGQEGESRFWPLAVIGCNWEHAIDLQQLWAQAMFLAERGNSFELTDAEKAAHAEKVKNFAIESDVNIIISDLNYRRQVVPRVIQPKPNWQHASAKDLLTHFMMQVRLSTQTDLNSALEREGYQKTTIHGKSGFWVPPLATALPK